MKKKTNGLAAQNQSYLFASFALLIGRERNRLGITQRELAARSGIAEAYLSDLLNQRRNLTMKTMARIAAALGCCISINFEQEMSNG